MKLQMAKSEPVELDEDPRYIKDPVRFNRLRLMIFEEAIDRAWGCPLYILHRMGWITNEQREAGDRYQQLTQDMKRTQANDPDECIPEGRELIYRRTKRYKSRWRDAVGVLAGCRQAVDRIVLDEEYPTSQREKVALREGLKLLTNFFIKGTKRVRQK
jgi:hypothetical protein